MNVVSVSWGDHLAFGEGDGRLAAPEAVARRMRVWRDELDAAVVHWRVFRRRIPGTFFAAPGHVHPSAAPAISWDEFAVVPEIAHHAGMEALLYVSIFDEGWPLAPPDVRERSHHNAMHGKEVAWQSAFSLAHPQYVEVARDGTPQHGVLSLAFEQVRAHFIQRFTGWLQTAAFDGLFLCLRSQSRPADDGDQFGFSEPVRDEFRRRYGADILTEDFDRGAWRDLRGEYLTTFVRELRATLRERGRTFAIGVPRGDVIGPPLGNMTLEWRRWLREGLVDALVVNQHSTRCPSMWHQLWPMHRGTGYVQNYVTGEGLPSVEEHVCRDYGPLARDAHARLFVARQWDPRNADAERRLMSVPGVTGLVFSSFRHDNPAAIARGDWQFPAPPLPRGPATSR